MLLAGVLVAGCTGRATPSEPSAPSPSVSVGTTSTPTPTPTPDLSTPPARPEAMATPSAEGAAAAASYFISLYPYVYVTGDFSEWDALSAPECEFCSNTKSDVQRMFAAGNRTTGAPVEIVSSEGIELSDLEWYSAKLRVRQAEGAELDPTGSPVSTNPAALFDFDVAMTWSDGWRIDSIGIVPVEQG